MDKTLVGYKITRPDCGGWLFAGVTPAEVALAVQNEIESNDGLGANDHEGLVIKPFEITQKEIDDMPEFPGW